MAKLFKILLSLVLLIIVALVALPFIIDPNDYRDEIVSAVEKQTGRKLQMDGELKLSVFPWVGIEMGKMALGNAAGFGDQPFAAIDAASVKIKLLPLISSSVEADTITLDGLQLNLAKNKQGISNWADLAAAGSSTADKQAAQSSSSGSGFAALAIGGVSINRATVNWQDMQAGQSYQVKDFNLNSGVILPGKPVDLSISMNLDSSEPKLSAAVNLDGTFEFNLDLHTLSVTPLTFKLKADGPAIPGGSVDAALKTDITADLEKMNVSLKDLTLNSGNLALSGNADLTDLTNSAGVKGQLAIAEMNLAKFLASLGITLPEMADAKALHAFALTTAINGNKSAYAIENLNIQLDSSTIKGNARQAGTHTAADLKIDQINIDHYLPSQQAASETAEKQPAPPSAAKTAAVPASGTVKNSSKPAAGKPAAATEPELFPVELIRGLDIDTKLAIDKLIVSNLTSEQVKASVKSKAGKLTATADVGGFYKGRFNSTTNLNVAGKTPALDVVAKLNDLSAGPMLKDLTGKDTLDGNGNFNINITSAGNSVSAIKKKLNGKLDLALKNGAVKGINLAQVIRDTKARFEGKQISSGSEPQQTDFSEMTASATITNGVINNQDLLAMSPFLRVKGAGKINLPAETLNYMVETSIVETSKGQGGKNLEELQGLTIPVKLSGSYLAPEYEVDWGKVLLSSQKAKVDEQLEKKKDELKQKVEKKFGDKLLKGLF